MSATQAQPSRLVSAWGSKHPGLEEPQSPPRSMHPLLCSSKPHNSCPGEAASSSIISAAFGGPVSWAINPVAPVVCLDFWSPALRVDQDSFLLFLLEGIFKRFLLVQGSFSPDARSPAGDAQSPIEVNFVSIGAFMGRGMCKTSEVLKSLLNPLQPQLILPQHCVWLLETPNLK